MYVKDRRSTTPAVGILQLMTDPDQGEESAGQRGVPTIRSTGSDTHSSWIEESRFPPGTQLTERYRIVGRLGKGGMGEVYRADDLKLGQSVALKFLSEKLAEDEASLRRLHDEVRIAREIAHPSVCRVYDIGEADGVPFITMEYVDGEDLSILLRRIGRFPTDRAVQVARQVCAGLAAAHDKGVLHRDLKPANVMIDGRGRVRITDFGIAALADQMEGRSVQAGTPAYMAPEQLAGREVTIQSDIYSLGLILYEIFTGKEAFHAETLAQVQNLRESGPTTPSSHVPDMDPVAEQNKGLEGLAFQDSYWSFLVVDEDENSIGEVKRHICTPESLTGYFPRKLTVRRQSIWHRLSYFLRDTFLPILSL